MAGKLYIIGTPIGNLKDISLRAKQILSEVDFILAEDTRVSIKLLNHFDIRKTLISCHDYNEETRLKELELWAKENKSIGLISDAGMPLISDPGYKIVNRAISLDMKVIVIPGASSVQLALIGSGLSCQKYCFEGFLSDKLGERQKELEKLKNEDRTMLFFVGISQIAKVIKDMLEIFGNRKACLARELTKIHEEFIRGSLRDILEKTNNEKLKGECVLVVEGQNMASERASLDEVKNRLAKLLDSGAKLKEVSLLLAKETGWHSSEIYQIGLSLKEK